MSALKPDGRQYALQAVSVIVFGDIPGSDAVDVIELPQNAVVTSMVLVVDTAFAGGSTHDLDIGDTADPDRYTQTIAEIDASGIPTNAPAVSGSQAADDYYQTESGDEFITVTPTHTGGNPSSGSARLIVEYYIAGRQNENQGDA